MKFGYFGDLLLSGMAVRIISQLEIILGRPVEWQDCMDLEFVKFALNHPGESWKIIHNGTTLGMIRYRNDDVETTFIYSQFTD